MKLSNMIVGAAFLSVILMVVAGCIWAFQFLTVNLFIKIFFVVIALLGLFASLILIDFTGKETLKAIKNLKRG